PQKWSDDSRHIEDLQRPGKDRERFRMYRLLRARFDEPPAQPPARAFICKKQTDWPGSNDQHFGIECRVAHVQSSSDRLPWQAAYHRATRQREIPSNAAERL